jgi:hypothetical protein
MLSRIRRLTGEGKGPWIVCATVLAALLATPFALAAGEGQPLRGGARNPGANPALQYVRETQILSNNATYSTRQSNFSANGGGAIYGCRSRLGGTPAGQRPCIRANNLSTGRAFEFNATLGPEVGRIDGPATAAPFTTSAQGVATGLNADRVDSKGADEITADAVAAARAQNRFAVVADVGTLLRQRGATSVALAASVYTVTFADDVSACSYQATINDIATPGEIATQAGPAATQVRVATFNSAGAAAQRAFQLTVVC